MAGDAAEAELRIQLERLVVVARRVEAEPHHRLGHQQRGGERRDCQQCSSGPAQRRQKCGSRITSTVKISSRPVIMQKESTSFTAVGK